MALAQLVVSDKQETKEVMHPLNAQLSLPLFAEQVW